jgi:hypothetical protein
MTDAIASRGEDFGRTEGSIEQAHERPRNIGRPSNEVYARVGDTVLRAARAGVRDGLRPEDIIREIVSDHHVRLNLSEFRLLLASRRLGGQIDQPISSAHPITATP